MLARVSHSVDTKRSAYIEAMEDKWKEDLQKVAAQIDRMAIFLGGDGIDNRGNAWNYQRSTCLKYISNGLLTPSDTFSL